MAAPQEDGTVEGENREELVSGREFSTDERRQIRGIIQRAAWWRKFWSNVSLWARTVAWVSGGAVALHSLWQMIRDALK